MGIFNQDSPLHFCTVEGIKSYQYSTMFCSVLEDISIYAVSYVVQGEQSGASGLSGVLLPGGSPFRHFESHVIKTTEVYLRGLGSVFVGKCVERQHQPKMKF